MTMVLNLGCTMGSSGELFYSPDAQAFGGGGHASVSLKAP